MRILPQIIPLLTLLACGGPSKGTGTAIAGPEGGASKEVVAKWKGGELTLADVEGKLGQRLAAMEQEYQLQRFELMSQALDGAVDDAILEAEVKKRGVADVRALLKLEVEEKVEMPDEAEIAEFYGQVKSQLGGASLEQVQSMLVGELMQRRMAERYDVYVKELRESAGVEAAIPYPDLARVEIEVVDSDPVRGPSDAPVTIVQYAEYQCYFCNKVAPTLDALIADYDGKVRMVFKDFPLENHPRAFPAAVAARCAGEQDKYWEMNRLLLANQSRLSDADFAGYASEIGLDAERFSTCLGSGSHDGDVRAAFATGQEVGVQATPTFYINGLLVSGAQPYDRFKAVIEQELAKR